MRVKICGVRTEQDLKIAIKAGADAVGLLVGQLHASPDFILPSTAARLAKSIPPYITPAIVTHLVEPEEIMDIVVQSGITTIQLHGGSSPEQVAELRDLMPPGNKLIIAAHVADGSVSPDIVDYYRLVDAVLLDSLDRSRGMVGGTGSTHDWFFSSSIVEKCPLPIILAGGLNPSNVASAITTVKPFGVDANSGLKGADGGRCPDLCSAFVKEARRAWLNLQPQ